MWALFAQVLVLFVCLFSRLYSYYEFGLVEDVGIKIHPKPLESQFIHFSVLIFDKNNIIIIKCSLPLIMILKFNS